MHPFVGFAFYAPLSPYSIWWSACFSVMPPGCDSLLRAVVSVCISVPTGRSVVHAVPLFYLIYMCIRLRPACFFLLLIISAYCLNEGKFGFLTWCWCRRSSYFGCPQYTSTGVSVTVFTVLMKHDVLYGMVDLWKKMGVTVQPSSTRRCLSRHCPVYL